MSNNQQQNQQQQQKSSSFSKMMSPPNHDNGTQQLTTSAASPSKEPPQSTQQDNEQNSKTKSIVNKFFSTFGASTSNTSNNSNMNNSTSQQSDVNSIPSTSPIGSSQSGQQSSLAQIGNKSLNRLASLTSDSVDSFSMSNSKDNSPRQQTSSQSINSSTSENRKIQQENSLIARLDKLHQRHYQKIYTTLQQDKYEDEAKKQVQVDQQNEQIIKSINDILSQHLNETIEQQFQTILLPMLGKNMINQINAVTKNALVPIIVHTIKASTGNKPETQNADSSTSAEIPAAAQPEIDYSELGEIITNNLKQEITNSFRINFQSVLLPSFENSTRAMLKQINDTIIKLTDNCTQSMETKIEQFLAKQKTNLSTSSASSHQDKLAAKQQQQQSDDMQELKQMVQHLTITNAKLFDSNQSLFGSLQQIQNQQHTHSIEFANLTKLVNESHSMTQQAAGAVGSLPGSASVTPSQQKQEIKQLLSDKKYDLAFTKALSPGKLTLVIWLLQQLDSRFFIQYKLPQTILLSLVQQIGFQFKDDVKLKITWLRECLMCLNPKDSIIKSHVSTICNDVIKHMDEHLQTTILADPTHELFDHVRMVKHLLITMSMSNSN